MPTKQNKKKRNKSKRNAGIRTKFVSYSVSFDDGRDWRIVFDFNRVRDLIESRDGAKVQKARFYCHDRSLYYACDRTTLFRFLTEQNNAENVIVESTFKGFNAGTYYIASLFSFKTVGTSDILINISSFGLRNPSSIEQLHTIFLLISKFY